MRMSSAFRVPYKSPFSKLIPGQNGGDLGKGTVIPVRKLT